MRHPSMLVGLVEAYSNRSADAVLFRKLARAKPSRSADETQPRVPHKARRLTDHETGVFVDAYLNGESISELAQQLGVHRATLHVLVRKLELRRPSKGLWADDQVATAVVRAYRGGQTMAEIGKTHAVSANTVRRMLMMAGEPLRPRGRRPTGARSAVATTETTR